MTIGAQHVSNQKVYFTNGSYYSGEYLGAKRHGIGVFVDVKMGLKYEGLWKNDKREGKGLLTMIKNDRAIKIYEGEWKDSKRHGYGENWYNESEYYEGEWNVGKRSGWGRMYYNDSSIYEGQWDNDMKSGRGLLYTSNGNRYEGEWANDKKNGKGKLFFNERKQILVGLWVDGVAKCGEMSYLPNLDKKTEDYKASDLECLANERFEIPELELVNPEKVLKEAIEYFSSKSIDD